MRPFLSAAILLIFVTTALSQSASISQNAPAATPAPAVLSKPLSTGQPRRFDHVRGAEHLFGGQARDSGAQARQMVLVVPTPELKPEALAAVTEDLTVMCRIFDKTLAGGTQSVRTFAYVGRAEALQRLLVPQTQQTQALYLDGYGAVFFIPVDFPLMPPAPPKSQAEPQPPQAGDQVWAQTVRELHGRKDETDQPGETGPTYDAQRVQDLKTTLIKMLRHAANIRTRRPQDYIVLAIGTEMDDHDYAVQWFMQKSDASTAFWPNVTARPRAGQAADLVPDPSATLILRAVKADLDAFAAGQLTLEQLSPKVETFWCWVPPQTPTPAPAATTPTPR